MGRSILLVDPDGTDRLAVLQKLDARCVQVVGMASDPEEAMRLAVAMQPDIALVAASLPNGHAIRLVSRLATEHGIPSVLLAHRIDELPVAEAAASGVMGLLMSPLNLDSLLAILEVAVSRFRDILAVRKEGESLRRALENRETLERAKGLLMAAQALSEEEALARIRQKSMDTQRPMAEIARAIILAARLAGKIGGARLKSSRRPG